MEHKISWRLLLALTITLFPVAMGACKGEKTPPPQVKPAPAVPVAKPTAPSQPAPTARLTTTKRADPSRMPRDRIHAPFHRSRSGAHGGMAAKGAAPTTKSDGHQTLPLPLKGAGGAEELKRRLGLIKDPAVRARVEAAFRKTFTLNRSKRDPMGAAKALTGLTNGTDAATAQRILGYVAIQARQGFGVALEHYKKAVALDPKYGEAHYALAFTYVISDRVTGAKHFARAMALGVPDTRGLGQRFYKPAPAPSKSR